MRNWKIPIMSAVLIFLVDLALKSWVDSRLPLMSFFFAYPFGGIPLFKDVGGISFCLVHAVNKGVAFGMLASFQDYLIWIRWAVSAALLAYLIFSCPKALRIPCAMIFAGAMGNICDYYIYGHVVDMFHVQIFNYSYPVFNLADSAICCGALWIGWLSFREFFQKRVRECL